MTDPFDVDQIRRNWERALLPAEPARAPAPPAPPLAPPPPDPLALARSDLGHLETLVVSQFASQRPLIDPFVQQVRSHLDAIDEALAAGQPLAPLRAELDRALADLEDMLEVAMMLPP